MTKLYELTYLISPEIDEKELNSLSEKINSLIKEKGGVFKKENPALKKRLGYEINEKSVAYLKDLTFSLEAEKIEEIKKEVNSEKDIMRCFFAVEKPTKLQTKKRVPRKIIKPSPETEKKVELKEIEKKLEEILE